MLLDLKDAQIEFTEKLLIEKNKIDDQENRSEKELQRLIDKSLELLNLNRFKESIIFLSKALMIDPNSIEALYNKSFA